MGNYSNFRSKINCIYEHICHRDIDKLTKLFLNETEFDNRKIHIERKWLVRDLTPRLFKKEYEGYKFSKLTLNDKRLFRDANEFLEIGLDAFCKRVLTYADSKRWVDTKKIDVYPYLYMPNYIAGEFFNDYYTLEYREVVEPSTIAIGAKPPANKSYLNIDDYKGVYIKKEHTMIFRLENSSDYMVLLFNSNSINKNVDYIVGLAIGIADTNKSNVIAKKAIISKHKFSDEELKSIYLTLNESEILDTKENLFLLEGSNENIFDLHFKKYSDKIDRFKILLEKLVQDYSEFQGFYKRVALSRFSNVSEVLLKSANNRAFFTADKVGVLENLIASYDVEKFDFLKIVMPYRKNVFKFYSNRVLKLKEDFLQLAKSVKLEVLFVLDRCDNRFDKNFIAFLDEAQRSGIKIGFVNFKEIKDSVESIDFMLTSSHDFTIAKSLLSEQSLYSIYTSDIIYEDYLALFNKIDSFSIGYSEFKENDFVVCKSGGEVLDVLVGEWYIYFYGNKKFWANKLVINNRGRVEMISYDRVTDAGTIDIKKRQALITLEDVYNGNLMIITFDVYPKEILQKNFFVKIVAKVYGDNGDIFSVGLCSREELDKSAAKEILGVKGDRVLIVS